MNSNKSNISKQGETMNSNSNKDLVIEISNGKDFFDKKIDFELLRERKTREEYLASNPSVLLLGEVFARDETMVEESRLISASSNEQQPKLAEKPKKSEHLCTSQKSKTQTKYEEDQKCIGIVLMKDIQPSTIGTDRQTFSKKSKVQFIFENQ